MKLKRRDFINLSALAAGSVVAGISACNTNEKSTVANNGSADLKSMTDDVVPITLEERKSRIAKAQQLLGEQKIDALILDSGTSLVYFTGIHWWPSERTMVAIIPAKGDPFYVCPGFEE